MVPIENLMIGDSVVTLLQSHVLSTTASTESIIDSSNTLIYDLEPVTNETWRQIVLISEQNGILYSIELLRPLW
jgi:hypothetical protein